MVNHFVHRFNLGMAREEHSPEKFEAIAKELSDAAAVLSDLAETLRSHKMPHVLIHGSTNENFHLPAVLDWVGKTNIDSRTQLRAWLNGIQSKAELQRKYNDRKRKAAAKRPPKRPGT
ncbi:hypothetical protein [Schlesneria sp. T3-172]|uniref:hypothetical protein n=1 Tax=Schlesneria sphaerica TaxID=3373610 RepID=UPI0037C552EF